MWEVMGEAFVFSAISRVEEAALRLARQDGWVLTQESQLPPCLLGLWAPQRDPSPKCLVPDPTFTKRSDISSLIAA